MYAVIKTGGKQYRVSAGDKLRVEKIPGSVGEKVELSEVLRLTSRRVEAHENVTQLPVRTPRAAVA